MSESARTTDSAPEPATPVEDTHRPWDPTVTALDLYQGAAALPTEPVTVTREMLNEARQKAAKYPVDAGVSERHPRSLMLDSVVTEHATTERFGTERDSDVYDAGDGDGGIDHAIGSTTVNTKARRYMPPYLLIPEGEKIIADAYLVCDLPGVDPRASNEELCGREVTVRFWGWVPDYVAVSRECTEETGPRDDVRDRTIYPDEMEPARLSAEKAAEESWAHKWERPYPIR